MRGAGTALGGGIRTLLAGALVAVGLVGIHASIMPASAAEAADMSKFQAGNIIADQLFFDRNAMSVVDIQAFLNAKVPTCSAGYTCLKSYRQTTQTKPGTPMCSTYTGASNETAATIIYKVAQACGISPKVILVMLQKEQSLVTSTAPSSGKYRSAMGAGCPDTAACDVNYYGFFQQVHYGAYLLKRYTMPPGTGPGTAWDTRYDLWKPVGQTSPILYNPNSGCGAKNVFIANQATHSLYIYTPYTPNQAAINAGYGIGDGCSSYGNRNFFSFYTDWFGSTQVPPLRNTSGAASVLGTPQVGQTLNGYPGVLVPNATTTTCVWLRDGVAQTGDGGCLYQVQPADVGRVFAVTTTSTRSGYLTLTQTSAATPAITAVPTPVDGFNSVTPARIAESRTTASERTVDARSLGTGMMTPGKTITIPVLGRAGIPLTGVGAVVLNVTAVKPDASSWMTVYATGQPRPRTSNLNFTAGQNTANTVISQVGADGSITIFNADANTHVIVDIAGWLPATGITAVTPARIAETRSTPGEGTVDGQVQGVGMLMPAQTLKVPVLGRAGIPLTGVGAVVLNVTAVQPSVSSWVTVYPTGQTRPRTSSLSFTAGQNTANTVIAQVGADGSISIFNSDARTDLIVDVAGWLPTAGITAVTPARIAETRNTAVDRTIDGQVQGVGILLRGQTLKIPVLGRAGIPLTGVGAVVLNVTAVQPSASSWLTVYPTGQTRPWTSSLNFTAGSNRANTVITQVGADGSISVYNADARTHLVVDISGWLPG